MEERLVPLTAAMDNVDAWRLGKVVSAARDLTGGDYIDTGLGLRRLLEDAGFTVAKLETAYPRPR